MKTADVIRHFGSVIAVAEALGINRSAVYQWGPEVPMGRAYELQVLTAGKLKAETEKRSAA